MGIHVNDYRSVDDALRQVMHNVRLRRTAQIISTEKSYGRVSAVEMVAPRDVPAHSTSHMDGFAVIADDLRNASEANPAVLNIGGEVMPGAPSRRTARHGEALRVATGATLPRGADAIIPLELVEEKEGSVIVNFKPEPGSHVYRAGADIRRDELVLENGHVVRAQDIGLLLGVGVARIRVWAKPRVSVVATGSELTDATRPGSGRVRNSHSPVFLELVEALGCIPIDAGVVRDLPKEVASRVRRMMAESDFVITLGGTSAGKHDVVGEGVSDLHPDLIFQGIKMDRGRVTGVAVVDGKPILMMPGPIQGAMNAFVLFGVPIIRLLSGRKDEGPEVFGRMGVDWEARKSFPNFKKVVYVRLRREDETVVEPLAGETESIGVLSNADGYIVVPEEMTRIEKGNRVRVRLLPGFSFAS